MAIYSLARNSTTTTSGNAAADLVAVGSGVRPRLMEWGITLGAATASSFSLRRSSGNGTRTSPVSLLAEDTNDPALTGITDVSMAVAWSVEPTEDSNALRRIALPATIGVGVIWTFPRGIVLPANAANQQLVVINDATNAASHNHHAVCDI